MEKRTPSQKTREKRLLSRQLLPETKITVLAYRTDKDEDGEPANRIVVKTLNY